MALVMRKRPKNGGDGDKKTVALASQKFCFVDGGAKDKKTIVLKTVAPAMQKVCFADGATGDNKTVAL
eukprot:13587892-Ditylum_brightwellii.AAC.1